MEDIFDAKVVQNVINRINHLTPESQRNWGKMSVDQMLAHCNVVYEMVYEQEKHKKPRFLMKLMMRNFVKPKTTNEIPYKPNLPTGPMFIMKGNKDFDLEKKRLIGFLQKTQQLGREAFDGKESMSFGILSANQWNNMFYKHLDHHLKQFSV